MRCKSSWLALAVTTSLVLGCPQDLGETGGIEAAPQGTAPSTGDPEATPPLPTAVDRDPPVADYQDCDIPGRASGGIICLDDLLPILIELPRDNDRDGIPNINDRDIDGDGILNRWDVDVDGDGTPNYADDDIDDDGVPNDIDIDIDGDFLRNQWDLDVDGDLLYNPSDNDADGDGRFKEFSLPQPDCGPVQLFNDRGMCCKDSDKSNRSSVCCDDDEIQNGTCDQAPTTQPANTNTETPDGDTGPTATNPDGTAPGQNMPDATPDTDPEPSDPGDDPDPDPQTTPPIPANGGRTAEPDQAEVEVAEQQLADVFPFADDVFDELRNADPDATRAEVLDAATEQTTEALQTVPGTGDRTASFSEAQVNEMQERRMAIAILADTGARLPELSDVTNRLADTRRPRAQSLPISAEVVREVTFHTDTNDLRASGATATELIAVATDADVPQEEVPTSVEPAANTADALNEVLGTVWSTTVNQVSQFRREDGGNAFSLPKVVRAAERIARQLDDPSLEEVDRSLGNVLSAASENGLSDPLAVVEYLEADENIDLGDGVSAVEATVGAEAVAAE